MVNITHAPIPELNWPEMKMDLAVSKDVDLNEIKVGDKVKFHIMLDDDNVFRIHHFEKQIKDIIYSAYNSSEPV